MYKKISIFILVKKGDKMLLQNVVHTSTMQAFMNAAAR